MKRNIIIFMFLLSSISLTGCGKKYPKITLEQSLWTMENMRLNIGDEYTFKDFSKQEEGDSLTVTFNFVKNGD